MGRAKKHHYVPKAYLRFFAKAQGNDVYKIYVFDKVSGREFISNINDIAEKHNYNKVENGRFVLFPPDGDSLFYEHQYTALIEGRIPLILNNLMAMCTLSNLEKPILTESIKHDLAKIIVIQLLRTPQSREYTFKLGRPITDSVLQRIRGQIEQITDVEKRTQFIGILDSFEYTKQFVNSVHLQATTDTNRLEQFTQRLVENRSWVIYENKCYPYLPFVTSDHPVVMYNLMNQKMGFGANGLENPDTVISMPLTPKYMVSLYHKECVWGYFSQSYENKCILIDEPKFIFNQSCLQAEQCSRQVYALPDEKNYLIGLKAL